VEQNIIDTAVNEWRKHLRACVCTMGQHFDRFYCRHLKTKQLDKMSVVVSKMWENCVSVCYLDKVMIPLWTKCNISLVITCISQGSAGTDFGCSGKLVMTSWLINIPTKKLPKSDNPSSSYNRKCWKCLWNTLYNYYRYWVFCNLTFVMVHVFELQSKCNDKVLTDY